MRSRSAKRSRIDSLFDSVIAEWAKGCSLARQPLCAACLQERDEDRHLGGTPAMRGSSPRGLRCGPRPAGPRQTRRGRAVWRSAARRKRWRRKEERNGLWRGARSAAGGGGSGGRLLRTRLPARLNAGACGWKRRGRGNLRPDLVGLEHPHHLDVPSRGKDKEHEPSTHSTRTPTDKHAISRRRRTRAPGRSLRRRCVVEAPRVGQAIAQETELRGSGGEVNGGAYATGALTLAPVTHVISYALFVTRYRPRRCSNRRCCDTRTERIPRTRRSCRDPPRARRRRRSGSSRFFRGTPALRRHPGRRAAATGAPLMRRSSRASAGLLGDRETGRARRHSRSAADHIDRRLSRMERGGTGEHTVANRGGLPLDLDGGVGRIDGAANRHVARRDHAATGGRGHDNRNRSGADRAGGRRGRRTAAGNRQSQRRDDRHSPSSHGYGNLPGAPHARNRTRSPKIGLSSMTGHGK